MFTLCTTPNQCKQSTPFGRQTGRSDGQPLLQALKAMTRMTACGRFLPFSRFQTPIH